MTSRDFAIPSLALTIAASAISATAGYLYARGGSIEAGSRDAKLNNLSSQPLNTSTPLASVNNDDEDSGSEDESAADGDLAAISARFHQPCKLVLVVRTDLGMTPGKIAAQCSHATLACYKSLVKKNPQLVKHWERTGQAKIALKASSEEQLMELEAIAKSLNLCARSIQDAGRTEVAAGTTTVLGIGPAPVEIINQVTGKLRLL